MQGKKEIEYHIKCKNYQNILYTPHPLSVQEGFDYLFETFLLKDSSRNLSRKEKMKILGGLKGLGIKFTAMGPYMKAIFKGRRECFTDLEPYFSELSKTGKITPKSNLNSTYPNQSLWKELIDYINENWEDVRIGFTELPHQLIFKDKAVLFRYVLVVIQEMKKEKIDFAPKKKAGQEVMRIYASLGLIVNNLANWLRKKGINCQSNHPVGGLVCTPPLAGKAGMGWMGRNGMLITPEFGPRQRIAPIFIQEKLFEFTDSTEHKWIENYCKTCGLCIRSCPTKAIYEEKIIKIPDVPGIGAMKTCIDREKCFPQFNKTVGCSVCIKVCPFSKGPKVYEKLKKKFDV